MISYLSLLPDTLPVLILDYPPEKLGYLMDQLDGIVFQGGSDLSPVSYQEDHLDEDRWPGDLYRDKVELKIFEEATSRKLPILGICRGAQLINVAMGGTLYQDLEMQTKSKVEHRNAKLYDRVNHAVSLLDGSKLASIYQSNQIQVNSVHHQGIKKLASGLDIEAICESDQLIEAFSGSYQGSSILAVQWHPEFAHTVENELSDPKLIVQYFIRMMHAQTK